MKKILFISHSLGSGGAERQMTTIACILKEMGYHIEFLCFLDDNFYEYILLKNDIMVNRIISSNNLKLLFASRKFIRSKKFDVVISFLEAANFINNFSALGGKTWRVITGERSSMETTFHSFKNKILCYFQRYSNAIVCNSDNARKKWESYYPKYGNKLKVIYNTVTLQPIHSVYIPKRNGKLNIVIAASYQYLKNPIGIIKALNLLTSSQQDMIHVDWYGNNLSENCAKVYAECCKLIGEYNLSDVITLNGAISSIQDRMNEADMVALLSKVEGLPNVICEAMKLGKPIIMSYVSDYDRLVDSSNGYLVDWNDCEGIKNIFIEAIGLTDAQLYELGKNSKEKSEKLFSRQNIINQWITLFK